MHVHDSEPDHQARRSQLALISYLLSQEDRLRQGALGLAGNHVVLALENLRGYVALVHLQRGSVRVGPGESVRAGQPSPHTATRATPTNRTSTCRSWTESTQWPQPVSRWASIVSSSVTAAGPG